MESITMERAKTDLDKAKTQFSEKQDAFNIITAQVDALEEECRTLKSCTKSMEIEINEITKKSGIIEKERANIRRDLQQFKYLSEEISLTMSSITQNDKM